MNPKQNEKFYTLWSVGIFLCAALAVFAVIYASAVKKTAAAPDTAQQTQEQSVQTAAPAEISAETPNLASAAVLTQTEDQGTDYLDQCVFLGDATTYDLTYYFALPAEQVWTTADHALTLSNALTAAIVYPETGESVPLTQALSTKQPAYLIITLGRDDILLGKDAFLSAYQGLLAAVAAASPATRIICQSIFPVVEGAAAVTNEQIETGNAWIIQLCEQAGCRYLNTRETLADPSGGLLADYSSGDGIQISALGSSAVTTYVKTHAYP